MRHLSLSLLLFLVPGVVFGQDASPKSATGQPSSGDKSPPAPAADQGQPSQPFPEPDADADAENPKPRKPGPRPTAMAVVNQPGGMKALSIHFRWSLYPNSSVEVRLAPGAQAKGSMLAPIYFNENLTGKVRDAFYVCLDHTGESGHVHTFSKDKITYKMIGRRNALDKQGVHVQVHPEETKKGTEEQPAAAFLQLDTWAVNPETLSLDMPRDEFPKPGTLFVWFFRGDRVVWEEQIRWPGYKSR